MGCWRKQRPKVQGDVALLSEQHGCLAGDTYIALSWQGAAELHGDRQGAYRHRRQDALPPYLGLTLSPRVPSVPTDTLPETL